MLDLGKLEWELVGEIISVIIRITPEFWLNNKLRKWEN